MGFFAFFRICSFFLPSPAGSRSWRCPLMSSSIVALHTHQSLLCSKRQPGLIFPFFCLPVWFCALNHSPVCCAIRSQEFEAIQRCPCAFPFRFLPWFILHFLWGCRPPLPRGRINSFLFSPSASFPLTPLESLIS